MLVVIGGIVVALLVVAGAVWMLAPTMGTFRRPAFRPASGDDASVLRAQLSGMVDSANG